MGRFVTTAAPLLANATWTSDVIEPRGADRITGSVFADQAGTLFIEQAGGHDYGNPSATNWDVSTNYPVGVGDGKGFDEQILLPFVRIRYTNGATNQGAFRLRAQVQSAGGK